MERGGLFPARRRRLAGAVVVAVALGTGAAGAARPRHPAPAHPPPPQGWSRTPGLAERGLKRGWERHRGPVPILMYHVIEAPRAGVPNPLLYVSRRTFSRQMRWLDRHGFEGVTLDEVENAWAGRGLLPKR